MSGGSALTSAILHPQMTSPLMTINQKIFKNDSSHKRQVLLLNCVAHVLRFLKPSVCQQHAYQCLNSNGADQFENYVTVK